MQDENSRGRGDARDAKHAFDRGELQFASGWKKQMAKRVHAILSVQRRFFRGGVEMPMKDALED